MTSNRLPGNPLSRRDYEKLKASWITTELANQALLRRVNSDDGAQLVGRKITARINYAGVVFPYYWPGGNDIREYRLRRDKPDLEQQPDGTIKETSKYLSAPGARSMLYVMPGTPENWLHNTTIPIIFTEGEKKCIALHRLALYDTEPNSPRHLALAIPGVWNWRGSVGKAAGPDGERLNVKGAIADLNRITWDGREVFIFFDSNVVTNSMVKAARSALAIELRGRRGKIFFVDMPLLEGINGVDDLLAVQGPEAVLSLIKNARRADVKPPEGFRVSESGVYAVDPTGEKDDIFICSPLRVVASTRDHQSENWGQLVEFTDMDGIAHSWLMPMSLLAGDGGEMRERFLSMGLRIAYGRRSRELLSTYIIAAKPEARARCVTRVGWHDNVFCLPDETFGEDDKERVVFQSATGSSHNIIQRGTLEDWRENVSAKCVGNPALVFAVACAFAGPLMPIVGEGGGGFHFRGDSSTGKTTALLVAGSVWGGGGKNGYVQSWRTTANGLEAIAELHNHGLLCLDELGQCDARESGEIAYALANGTGKMRMTRSIGTRKKLEWELIFLSSGETSLCDHVQIAGRQVRAGQEVRLVDIDAKRESGKGLFDNIHGWDLPANFANHLTAMSRRYYGTAIRAYLSKLVRERAKAEDGAKRMRDGFLKKYVAQQSSGEVYRVASRFALVASAGEFARDITGWPKGETVRAAAMLFQSWLARRGTSGSSDIENAIHQVRHFIESHGASRFQDVYSNDMRVFNRAGFRKTISDEETEYYILPEVFKKEVCSGYDHKVIATVLAQREHLIKGEGYHLAKKQSLPEVGKVRVFVVRSSILSLE